MKYQTLGVSATVALAFLAVSKPALAHDYAFYTNVPSPTYSQFLPYYGLGGNYDQHAIRAQQHADAALRHAQPDSLYASPRHARRAWEHAIRDAQHAQADSGNWWY